MKTPTRDSDGDHTADALVWVLSMLVILWAIWGAFASPPAPALSVDDCVQRGFVETAGGPVFCVLIPERKET